jgi:hypothetical protein
MRHSSITLTMGTHGHLFPGQEADTVARLPEMICDDLESEIGLPGCPNSGDQSGQQFGQQLEGWTGLAGATGGEPTPLTTAGPGDNPLAPQVLTTPRINKSRRVLATPGLKAEGKGLEPSTGKPAPDFELYYTPVYGRLFCPKSYTVA